MSANGKRSRNSGQRAYREVLALATARLERNEAELDKCNRRVMELSEENPQLREMIAVTRRFLGLDKPTTETQKPRRPNMIAGIPIERVPKDLQDFLKPKETILPLSNIKYSPMLNVDSSDDDGALLPALGGEEILP